jgi:hypothetical protein
MESKIWYELRLCRGVNRRTIDQTVVTPTITTTLQQNDWLPFQTITQEILSRIQNK